MPYNPGSKKKTLVVSMLAFLLFGGGVFLFFIIQGSNDLTGSQKSNFRYGDAAREGVASFFRSVGLAPDEDPVAKKKERRMVARGFLEDGEKAVADVSDWMANNDSGGSSSSPAPRAGSTAVPRMSGAGGSRAGGGGGGGSKSAGGVSRFGEGSSAGNTTISARAQAGAGGAGGKGTLGSLRNARALLGDGLRSDSAMTARSKWGQSFGASTGGGKSGGDLAYAKSGLVNLDKIKSGEIKSLKPGPIAEVGAFERDKDAEKKDPTLNAAKEKAKADMEAESKKAAAKALADAAANAASQTPKADDKGAPNSDPQSKDANGRSIPADVQADARSLALFQKTDLGGGATCQDKQVEITGNPDGSYTYRMSGTQTTPSGVPGEPDKVEEYTDTIIKDKNGKYTFL